MLREGLVRLRRSLARVDDTAFVLSMVGLGYIFIARGIENFYPFSTFSMYASVEESSASRVIVREDDGTLGEVSSFSGYDCDRPIDLHPQSCKANGEYYSIDYIDREVEFALRQKSTASKEASRIKLLRRIWRFDRAEGTSVEDCTLAICHAVRK